MNSSHLLPTEIAEALERGSTVVTGNQRAARTLRLAYDRQNRANGLTRWRPPEIYAWDTWTLNLWRELLLSGDESRLLLNRSQELQVWSSIIGADGQLSSLQTRESLATMAANAWNLLCQYRGQQRLKSIGVSGDTRAFQRWAQEFTRRCQTDEYLPQAQIEEALQRAAAKLVSLIGGRLSGVLLKGFDRLTPAQRALVEALEEVGIRTEGEPPGSIAMHTYLSEAKDLSGELDDAATSIGKFLESHSRASVAVIVPDVETERGSIERTFREILAPELLDISAPSTSSPFEFSLGRPLTQSPMVSVALDLAHWAAGPLTLTSISHLLLSPYFAGTQQERTANAEFDAFDLRRQKLLQPELSLDGFISFVEGNRSASRVKSLLSQLHAMRREVSHLLAATEVATKQKPWSEWAENIRQMLAAVGWTTGCQLDSVEFQTREKWEGALDELATLDFEGVRATYSQALTTLEAILSHTLFAPESHSAPVQIMSPQEAAGSRFDAVYFLRANDEDWPKRPGTNPLLGWRLQRELGMPGSNTDADHARAQQITSRLAASAETIVFSYAKETAEGRQRPSPLLNGFDLETIDPSLPRVSDGVELDSIMEEAVPLTDFAVHGGADILKLQAACGFRAFAEKRLWSTELKTQEPGMDAGERGEVVHSVLEHFWEEVRTQAALLAMSRDERREQIDRSVERGLGKVARTENDAASPAWVDGYRDSQRRRLRRLLARWLERELDRVPFEVVSREKSEEVQIGPLSLNVRFDRVDRLVDQEGREVLIDYKTSKSTVSDWRDHRPNEPQLPLYAAVREPGSTAALAFAVLRPGKEMTLTGFEDTKGLLANGAKKPPLPMREQIEDWKWTLTTLAEEFAAGSASVEPKQYPATCKYCKQRTLCRLDPATLREEFDEDEDYYNSDPGLFVGDHG